MREMTAISIRAPTSRPEIIAELDVCIPARCTEPALAAQREGRARLLGIHDCVHRLGNREVEPDRQLLTLNIDTVTQL